MTAGDGLRGSDADRRRATDVLDTALREARLDAREHDERTQAVTAARTRGEIDRLIADLPARLGVREWTPHLRVRQADREQVSRWLGDARAEERLTEADYEKRLAGVAAAGTYADFQPLVDGVPGPPDSSRDDLLVSAADRQAALHRNRQAAAKKATRYRQLDEVLKLRRRADPAERARVVRRLDEAHATGRLNAEQHAERVSAARAATRDSELARLLADLTTDAPSLLSLKSRHRLSDGERQQAVQELQHGLDAGRLTLDEYDERVRRAYAAETAGALRPLLADLLPSPPAEAATSSPQTGRRLRWPVAVAIVREPAAFVALDPRTGKQRWRLAAPKRCRTYSATTGADTAALLDVCEEDHSLRLSLIDIASGKARWRAPLRVTADDENDHDFDGNKATLVVSVDPLVVRTSDENGAFVGFGPDGKRRWSVPQAQPDLDLAYRQFPEISMSRPAYPVTVHGDALVVPARRPSDDRDTAVAAFSVTDGRRLWVTDLDWVSRVDVGESGVLAVALGDLGADQRLVTLSAQDGAVSAEADLGEAGFGMEATMGVSEIVQAGDRYVLVYHHTTGTENRPLTVLGPRP